VESLRSKERLIDLGPVESGAERDLPKRTGITDPADNTLLMPKQAVSKMASEWSRLEPGTCATALPPCAATGGPTAPLRTRPYNTRNLLCGAREQAVFSDFRHSLQNSDAAAMTLDESIRNYFASGNTTVTRPFTMGFRSPGVPHVSGSATQVPGFMRL